MTPVKKTVHPPRSEPPPKKTAVKKNRGQEQGAASQDGRQEGHCGTQDRRQEDNGGAQDRRQEDNGGAQDRLAKEGDGQAGSGQEGRGQEGAGSQSGRQEGTREARRCCPQGSGQEGSGQEGRGCSQRRRLAACNRDDDSSDRLRAAQPSGPTVLRRLPASCLSAGRRRILSSGRTDRVVRDVHVPGERSSRGTTFDGRGRPKPCG